MCVCVCVYYTHTYILHTKSATGKAVTVKTLTKFGCFNMETRPAACTKLVILSFFFSLLPVR